MKNRASPSIAAVLVIACCASAAPARASNLAAEVAYPPLSDFPCKAGIDVAIDIGASVAKQCFDRFADKEKLGDYLLYVPQGLFALAVPVTREWFIAEVTSKLSKDAKVCIAKGLVEGAGGTPEQQKLVSEAFETYLAIPGTEKFIKEVGKGAELFKVAREQGGKAILKDEKLRQDLVDFQKFAFYFDKKVKGQLKAAAKPISVTEAFVAWFDTPDRKARREAADAQQAVDECAFPAATAKLLAAQTLNAEWLGVLRKEISRTRKNQQCEEGRLLKNPARGLEGDNPYGVNKLRELGIALQQYKEAERDLIQYMDEVSTLATKFDADEQALKELRALGQKELEQAKAALQSCDLNAAQRHVDALGGTIRDNRCNQMTQTGPTPFNDEFALREKQALAAEIQNRMAQIAQEKNDAQAEYDSVIALVPTTLEECKRIDLVATFFERWATEDACRDRLDAGAKATGLRNKASACKLALQQTPPPISGVRGLLVLDGEIEVKKNSREAFQPYDREQGGDERIYSLTKGQIVSTRLTYEGKQDTKYDMSWTFSGIPASIAPGATFTIKASGRISVEPDPSHAGSVSGAWVEVSGLEAVGEAKLAGIGHTNSRGFVPSAEAEWTFRLPEDRTTASISFGADGGIGEIAKYKYKSVE